MKDQESMNRQELTELLALAVLIGSVTPSIAITLLVLTIVTIYIKYWESS